MIEFENRPKTIREDWLLFVCFILAAFIETAVIKLVAHEQHSLAHPPHRPIPEEEAHFVEAELKALPQEAKLIQRTLTPAAPKATAPEKPISIQPKSGQDAHTPPQALPPEENQVESRPPLPVTHGPIALYAPSPILPSYLQNRAYRAHVSIEFTIDAHGVAKPRLVTGSGDEELDALAITTVKSWRFRAAEKDYQPVPSHVRLKIVFDVH